MMGAQVQASDAIDLASLTDAKIYKERLKALNEQVAQAKALLEQAKAENQAMVAKKEEVTAINAATMEMLNKNLSLEEDMRKREGAMAARAQQLADKEYTLNKAKEEFEALSATTRINWANREEALRQNEAAHEIHKNQVKEEMDKSLADRQAQLEAISYKAVKKAEAAAEKLARKEHEAQVALDAANAKKVEYKTKVADLKKAIG